jgi:uncharacterized protein (DUF934 family)
MSATDMEAVTRLWTPLGFCDDGWAHAASADSLAGNARVILSLAVYLGLDVETLATHGDRLGVHVLPGEALDPLLPHLARLPLVSLAFPAFNDGRSYSKAELLRARHGYTGIVRASGDVLIDQIPLMLRVGFSEFEVTNPIALTRLASGELGGIPYHYQPTARSETKGAGYSWRRLPAN